LTIIKVLLLKRPYQLEVTRKKLFGQKSGLYGNTSFLLVNNIELAKERVKIRVKEGGHSIPEEVIERRFLNGIKNLFELYLDIVDGTIIFDNSHGKHELIAHKIGQEDFLVTDNNRFNELKRFYDNQR